MGRKVKKSNIRGGNKLQKCEKCHTKLNWMGIYKSEWKSFRNRNTVNCRKCDTEHNITIDSKIIRTVLITLSAVISSYIVLYHIDTYYLLSLFLFFVIYLMVLAIIFTITPFVYKYHSKFHSNYKELHK
ncbi:TIGR04104 family putative zinc finger protein [Ornithinibacillus xuwenensis]|uniref:TIGR04104 family putative zinc finger protein n=1 Tax=Ornithinibacillus xuwenensis TaxID=3144668 RepID=UPI003D00CA6F